MNKYAPPSENKTEEYIGYILKKTGASRDDLVGSMSDSDLNSFMDVISRFEGFGVSGEIIPLGKPVAIKLNDKLSNPLQNSSIAIKSGDKSVLAKTDKNGNLPVIYSGLFGREITLYYSRAKDELEKITKLVTNSVSSAYTLKAPYFAIFGRPQVHKTDGESRALVHIVLSGETLSNIAKKYGITAGALVKENGLVDENRIYVRQHLRVPTDKVPDAISAHDATAKPGGPAVHRAAVVSKSAQKQEKQPLHPVNTRALAVVQQRSSNGHPLTVLSSPTLELSGSAWCARFKGSDSIDSLNSSYKAKVTAFFNALKAANINSPKISAAFRPLERSYLMYNAFHIAKGKLSPDKIGPYPGVNIDWVHRTEDGKMDSEASKKAAVSMCAGYKLSLTSAKQKVGAPGSSRHNYGAAVDIAIGDYLEKTVKNSADDEVELKSFKDLVDVGKTYGVFYYPKENMHWSDTGN
jgi:LysM repeat protein